MEVVCEDFALRPVTSCISPTYRELLHLWRANRGTAALSLSTLNQFPELSRSRIRMSGFILSASAVGMQTVLAGPDRIKVAIPAMLV